MLTSYLVSNAIVLPISAWLVGRDRTQALLHDLRGALHGQLISVRDRALARHADLFRVLQGAGGGGLQPSEQAILADTFPPEQPGHGVRHLWDGGGAGAGDRTDTGRLDNRQLQLALDLLSSTFRSALSRCCSPIISSRIRPILKSAWSTAPQPSRTEHRLHRNRADRARHRLPAGGARQGSGGRLVRIALHRDPLDGHRGHLACSRSSYGSCDMRRRWSNSAC